MTTRARLTHPRTLQTLGLAVAALCVFPAHATAGPVAYLNKSDAWYASDEGRRIAANVLSHQSDHGGWPKNTDTTVAFKGNRKDIKPMFDNGATTDELRFLARAYAATGEKAYRATFEKGLDYILKAQYPTGGWPQSYPPPAKTYHRHITFNDNAMGRLMILLREVADDDRYALAGPERRKAAREAFARGVVCILKCQVKVGGKLTAWCAQHDENDYSPRPGRAYELPSLSGAESVGITRLLMSIDRPSPDVIRAVEGAVVWFEKAKISGMHVVAREDPNAATGRDRVVVADPKAPPLWARFHEIGTDKPIFSDRDAVKKYALAEIGHERRNGYAWYGTWPQRLLDVEYPAWKKRVASTTDPLAATTAIGLEPIPDRLVVLTFDDASKSHHTVARPLLLKHKFGATFFVTEGWDFATNKKDYMSWDEIAQLHKDGFEIGNHTIGHMSVTDKNIRDLSAQVKAINARCKEHGIPPPVSFAYPGNAITKDALPLLKDLGIKFARRGGSPEHPYKEGRGFAYEPGLDHPLLVPTAGDARPTWTLDDLKAAVAQARHGKIAVLQFHGVPDTAHDWVSVKNDQFEAFLKFLADEKYTVVALRDLAKYVDPEVVPNDPFGVIEDRRKLLAAKRDGSNSRPTKDDTDLRYWLDNTLLRHRFTHAEAGAAVGLTADEVTAAARRLGIDPAKQPERKPGDPLLVLPYPGGRHPRTAFRDGAIRPQRETKASVFAPWADGGYAVADVPEAVWFEPAPKKPELLYLAHTHVPTTWDRQKVALDPLEWTRHKDGSLTIERVLPNNVTLAAKVVPGKDGMRMEFKVTNGSVEMLTGLRVQMCVMLAGLTGFDKQTNENKVFAPPFAACKDATGKRWIITGWERCGRAWGNPPCPCLHADPVIEECPPGQTKAVRGWLSFYEGTDIDTELKRLKAVAFE